MHTTTATPAPERRRLRRLTELAVIAAVVVAAGCSPDAIGAPPSQPEPSPVVFSKFKDSVKAAGQLQLLEEGLQRSIPLAQPVVVSEMISAKGGKIEIKDLGLKVDIPKNAIPGDSIRITITAIPGAMVAYDFQPHGTKFLKPLNFEQDLKDTNWEKKDIKTTLFGAYFASVNQLDAESSLALINELIPAFVTGKKVEFDMWHFSGYMVSTGRAGARVDQNNLQ